MDAMEPAQPSTLPESNNQVPQSGGVFSRFKQAAGNYFAGGPDTSAAAIPAQPSFAPSTSPGLEPRHDAPTSATVPSPWANPDAAVSITPAAVAPAVEPSLGAAPIVTEPAASVTAEPVLPAASVQTEPSPALTPDPVVPTEPTPAPVEPTPAPVIAEPIAPAPAAEPTPTPTPEPVVDAAPTPEPSADQTGDAKANDALTAATEPTPTTEPTVSPVWTEEPADKVSDGVAPADLAKAGENAFKSIAATETPSEPAVEPVETTESPAEAVTETFTDADRAQLRKLLNKLDPGILGPDVAQDQAAPKTPEATTITPTPIDSANSTVIPTTPAAPTTSTLV